MEKVFVYGTLKRAGRISMKRMEGAEFVCEATTTSSNYKMYSLGSFPAVSKTSVVIDDKLHRVRGEVWLVDNATLAELDYIEGCPDFYRRELIETTAGLAYMYLINDADQFNGVRIWPDSDDLLTWTCRESQPV